MPLMLSWFAVRQQTGFAIPMLIVGTVSGLVGFVVALFFSAETKKAISAFPLWQKCPETQPGRGDP